MKKTALFTALLCLAQSPLHAAVPSLINYQGKVFDSTGLPLGSTGTVATPLASPINRKIIFRIYGTSSGGNPLWTEEQTATIALGEFSVVLGNGGPATGLAAGGGTATLQTEQSNRGDLSAVFANGADRFLEIAVDNGDGSINISDVPISPRQQITSTGYAFHAKIADEISSTANLSVNTTTGTLTTAGVITGASIATTGGGSITGTHVGNGAQLTELAGASITTGTVPLSALVAAVQQSLCPPGTVLPYMGSTAPSGWLLCNGASVSRSTYKDLFSVIGTRCGSISSASFNLPDFRGRFLRGWDNGSGRDPDKNSRTAMSTGGATGDNIGSIQTDVFKSHTHTEKTMVFGGTGTDNGGYNWPNYVSNTTTGDTGGNETRPINTYVNYIIKL